jgi:shikimate kinase
VSASVVLVGAPGSGKSSVGRQLARRLDLDFVDTDAAIEAATGQTMAELFIDAGADAVHAKERDILETTLAGSPSVVALGSGALDDAHVASQLTSGPLVVWLHVTSVNAISRTGLNVPRPVSLGNVRSQFSALLELREPLYDAVATHRVDTDHRAVADIVDEIDTLIRPPDLEGSQ